MPMYGAIGFSFLSRMLEAYLHTLLACDEAERPGDGTARRKNRGGDRDLRCPSIAVRLSVVGLDRVNASYHQ